MHFTIPQRVQTVQSWLDGASTSVVDAKLADHIITWAQTTLRNAVRENLEAPAKHFQYYCEHFLLNLNSCLLFVLAFCVLAEWFMMTCVFIYSYLL